MLAKYLKSIFKPRTRYPKSCAPAFVAIQLGFVAGGIGLVGRDALLFFTVQNWHLVIFAELCFASIITLGFFYTLWVMPKSESSSHVWLV